MKNHFYRLISLMLALLPLMASAQNNIQQAFDAIINCKQAKITESLSLDKDPETGIKTGQSYVYHFTLPTERSRLVTNAVNAFDNDIEKAYSVNRGQTTYTDNTIFLAVGNGEGRGVQISEPDHDYIYALFLAPESEDSTGIYRYAYAMNYKDQGKHITGTLVITYATTLKYRQQEQQRKQEQVIRGQFGGSNMMSQSQQSWFDMLMACFQSMLEAAPQTRIALATKAFKTICDKSEYPEVTSAETDAIREILKAMIADPKYSETILKKLLNQCLIAL